MYVKKNPLFTPEPRLSYFKISVNATSQTPAARTKDQYDENATGEVTVDARHGEPLEKTREIDSVRIRSQIFLFSSFFCSSIHQISFHVKLRIQIEGIQSI